MGWLANFPLFYHKFYIPYPITVNYAEGVFGMVVKIENISQTILRTFLPYLILKVVNDQKSTTAYSVMQIINSTFNVHFSPAPFYHIINNLALRGHLKKSPDAPTITITPKGKKLLDKVSAESQKIIKQIHEFLEQ